MVINVQYTWFLNWQYLPPLTNQLGYVQQNENQLFSQK